MEFHKVGNFRVGLDLSGGFRVLSPGGMVSRRFPFSSFSRVSLVFGRVASILVTDEALLVPDVFCSFTGRKIDLVYIHSIGIWSRDPASQWDVAVSSSLEFSESYHISIELSCLIEPLFPFPIGLPIGEGGGSHHDGKLLGHSSLKGIH